MKNYYFTFGNGHKYPNQYVKITAKSFSIARNCMYDYFGEKWCAQYSNLDDVHMNDRHEALLLEAK